MFTAQGQCQFSIGVSYQNIQGDSGSQYLVFIDCCEVFVKITDPPSLSRYDLNFIQDSITYHSAFQKGYPMCHQCHCRACFEAVVCPPCPVSDQTRWDLSLVSDPEVGLSSRYRHPVSLTFAFLRPAHISGVTTSALCPIIATHEGVGAVSWRIARQIYGIDLDHLEDP